jgi:hypothetical protein
VQGLGKFREVEAVEGNTRFKKLKEIQGLRSLRG